LAEEKDEKEFKRALQGHIDKIKAEGEDYDFAGFVFVGDIDFQKDLGVEVLRRAHFVQAKFEGKASFSGVCFEGLAAFYDAHFEKKVSFDSARFRGWLFLDGTQFQEGVSFRGARFEERTFITPALIKKEASFVVANLENTTLTPLNLADGALIDFKGARLRNTDIRRQDIKDHIKQEHDKLFSEAREIYLILKNNFHTLGRYDDESWAFRKEKDMERRSFLHFRKECEIQEPGEKRKDRGMKKHLYPLYNVFFYYRRTALYVKSRCCCISWQRMKALFCWTTIVPLILHPVRGVRIEFKTFLTFVTQKRRNGIPCSGRTIVRLVCRFYAEHPVKYVTSTVLKYLHGWGEWPWLIFVWCFTTIFVCSLAYYRWGKIVTHDGKVVTEYLKKLYFSGVTFTALGYGDYSPEGWARILSFFEAFLGVFFIALFVFSFARKTGGR